MRVGIAYPAFFSSFKRFFPELEIIKEKKDVKNFDLIIFSGGEDISPSLYRQNNTYSSYLNPERDNIEWGILHTAVSGDKKILGVCRGHQLILAAFGLKLIQDLEFCGITNHNVNHFLSWKVAHPLTKVIPTRVNSLHHQAVLNYGNSGVPLKILATVGDVVELTMSNHIITTQFHPEFMELTPFFDWVKTWATETSIAEISPSRRKRGSTAEDVKEYIKSKHAKVSFRYVDPTSGEVIDGPSSNEDESDFDEEQDGNDPPTEAIEEEARAIGVNPSQLSESAFESFRRRWENPTNSSTTSTT